MVVGEKKFVSASKRKKKPGSFEIGGIVGISEKRRADGAQTEKHADITATLEKKRCDEAKGRST